MSNPTPEQMNEAGYTTKYSDYGKKWWSVDSINWYRLVEDYHDE